MVSRWMRTVWGWTCRSFVGFARESSFRAEAIYNAVSCLLYIETIFPLTCFWRKLRLGIIDPASHNIQEKHWLSILSIPEVSIKTVTFFSATTPNTLRLASVNQLYCENGHRNAHSFNICLTRHDDRVDRARPKVSVCTLTTPWVLWSRDGTIPISCLNER
jgi:hypothetical protein